MIPGPQACRCAGYVSIDPRRFTKMEASEIDDMSHGKRCLSLSLFFFHFYSPCRVVPYGGAAPVGWESVAASSSSAGCRTGTGHCPLLPAWSRCEHEWSLEPWRGSAPQPRWYDGSGSGVIVSCGRRKDTPVMASSPCLHLHCRDATVIRGRTPRRRGTGVRLHANRRVLLYNSSGFWQWLPTWNRTALAVGWS